MTYGFKSRHSHQTNIIRTCFQSAMGSDLLFSLTATRPPISATGWSANPPPSREAQGRRSRPHNAKRAGAAVFTVRPPFSSRLRFGLRLLRLPLLLPFGKLPLALLALVESENVRQKAVDNRPPSPVPQWSSGLLSPSPL